MTHDAPDRINKAFVDPGAAGFDDLVPVVQQVVEVLAQDSSLDTKKRKSLVRAMKKAGMLAVRKIHVPKTWGKRQSKHGQTEEVHELCMRYKEEGLAAEKVDTAESMDSLAAECGSPMEVTTFPATPPLITRDSVEVTRLRQAHAGRAHPPPLPEGRLSPVPLAIARTLVKVLLFAPYVVLVGFLPFVLPTALSPVVFSPIINIAPGPLTPIDKFVYHARVLPYHVGASLALMFVALGSLGGTYPGFAASLLAAFVGRTMRAWGDYEPEDDVTHANLGVDDRSTILWLLKGFVLGDLTHSWKDFAKVYREPEEVEEGDEDVETETWEREGSHGIDFVIRLKDRPHECLRIVVDSADPTE